eukprot:s1600_g14.t1
MWSLQADVWTGEPGVRLCQFDNNAGTFFCLKGPGCEYCAEGDGGLAPTITPGSPWERSDDEDWAGPPIPSVVAKQLDYLAIPHDLLVQLDMPDCPFNVVEEVEQAKQHREFTEFMGWYADTYGRHDHVFGNPEEDLVEELLSFMAWLVETGRGDIKIPEESGTCLALTMINCLIQLEIVGIHLDQRQPASAPEPVELDTKASPVAGETESGGPTFPDDTEWWGGDAEWWDEGNEGDGDQWWYDFWSDPSQSWFVPWWFDYLSWFEPSWFPETSDAACNGDDMSWDGAMDDAWWWYYDEEPLGPTPAIQGPFGLMIRRFDLPKVLQHACSKYEATKAPGSAIPPEVLKRCFGKETPVTPHARRLLVAHAKEAKQEKKAEKEKNRETTKKKAEREKKCEKTKEPKVEQKKSKAKAKPKESKVDPGVEPVPKTKTPYALAKERFMEKFPASMQSVLYPCANIVTTESFRPHSLKPFANPG